MIYIKSKVSNEVESLSSFCKRLSKRNNSILYKLEEYLDKKLLTDEQLVEIRDIILTVSADINKIPSQIVCGDENEGLQ
jgi:hypothetical protein